MPPSSRSKPQRKRVRADAPRPAARSAPAPAPAASPWTSGGLPIVPLTILAAAAGLLLVALLIFMNSGGRGPGAAGASVGPTGQASSSPGTSAVAAASSAPSTAASPAGSGGPAISGPPIEQPARTTPPDLAFGRSLGSQSAPVQMDIWADFQCPACDSFTGSVEPYLIEKYIRPGTARLTFHDVATIGEESLGAAISARCADRQGKFWQYHDLLFANQGAENSGVFTRERSQQFAQSLGLDVAAFTACLDDTAVEDVVRQETTQGLGSGVKETPTLYVNGSIVRPASSSEAIDAAIAAALGGAPASPAASAAP